MIGGFFTFYIKFQTMKSGHSAKQNHMPQTVIKILSSDQIKIKGKNIQKLLKNMKEYKNSRKSKFAIIVRKFAEIWKYLAACYLLIFCLVFFCPSFWALSLNCCRAVMIPISIQYLYWFIQRFSVTNWFKQLDVSV